MFNKFCEVLKYCDIVILYIFAKDYITSRWKIDSIYNSNDSIGLYNTEFII